MSLLKSIGGVIKQVASVAAPVVGASFGGPVGGAIGTVIGQRLAPTTAPVSALIPAMGTLPQLGRLGAGAIGAGAAVAVRSAGSIARGAMAWCRRNPAWCATVGGTAAIEAMIQSGQLPMPRRRRGRGISGRDLRAYRRVHGVLAGFCAPKARIRKPC